MIGAWLGLFQVRDQRGEGARVAIELRKGSCGEWEGKRRSRVGRTPAHRETQQQARAGQEAKKRRESD
jgi:hypothetical protein